MARRPRIKPEPVPVVEVDLEPLPRYCHFVGCRPGTPPFARLTFKSAAGLVWSEGVCQGHQQFSADKVRREGGELLNVLVIPAEGG